MMENINTTQAPAPTQTPDPTSTPGPTPGPAKKLALGFAAILVFSTLVRLLYFYQQTSNPLAYYPIGDSLSYIMGAERILTGEWFGRTAPTFSGEAVYVYILAAVFALFGKNYHAVALVGQLMGALTCAVVYLTGTRLYGHGIGIALGLWASLLSPLLFNEPLILPTAPGMLFFALSLYFLVSIRKRAVDDTNINDTNGINLDSSNLDSSNGETGSRGALILRTFLAGLFLGLAAICRPNLLLLSPLYLLWTVIAGPGSPGSKDPKGGPIPSIKGLKALAPYALALILGSVVAIGPVTLKNYKATGELILITSSGGLNFYFGNNPQANGIMKLPLGLGLRNDATMYASAHKIAEAKLGRKLTATDASKYWFSEGVGFLKENPARGASLYLKKLGLFWNSRELTHIYKYDFFRDYSAFFLGNPLTGFGPLAALGLMGALWMLGRGSREERLLSLIVFTYMASILLFFVSSRLRLPITIPLLLTSGYALKRFYTIRDLRPKVVATVAAVLLVAFIYKDLTGEALQTVESNSFTYYQAARKFTKDRNYKEALRYYEKLINARTDGVKVYMADAASLYERTGDSRRARELYKGILEGVELPMPGQAPALRFSWSNPSDMAVYRALLRLGAMSFNQGDYDGAVGLLRVAGSGYPMGLEAHKLLGMSYERLGRFNEAISAFEAYLAIYPQDSKMRKKVLELRRRLG